MDNMDANTAMKNHQMKVNINTTIEVPLETMLAIRAGDARTVGLGPAISVALRDAVIDAIKAYPKTAGDSSPSPPNSSAGLREVDRTACEGAAGAVDEMEEMLRKSLLEDSRYKARTQNASKILAEVSDTRPASAADVKTDAQNEVGTIRIETPAEGSDTTAPITAPTPTGKLVGVRVGYKNLQMTSQFSDTSTMDDLIAKIRASLPKVPDHYRRLVWFADSRPEAEGIVLRRSTKLRNTDIFKHGIAYLQAGECKTAGPDEGPAPEERDINISVVSYNGWEEDFQVNDSYKDSRGYRLPGPKMLAARRARKKDPNNYHELFNVTMSPTSTFLDIKEAIDASNDWFKVKDIELYTSIEDMEAERQADDGQTLDETGINQDCKIYFG